MPGPGPGRTGLPIDRDDPEAELAKPRRDGPEKVLALAGTVQGDDGVLDAPAEDQRGDDALAILVVDLGWLCERVRRHREGEQSHQFPHQGKRNRK